MSDELLRKATEMRNAIDMIEGALMGLGDFVDLPDLFEGTDEHVHIAPKMTVGEMRRVCTALAECTRIINSDEFARAALAAAPAVGGEALEWAVEWHRCVETMMTMAGLSGAGSPSESIVEFQEWLSRPATPAVGGLAVNDTVRKIVYQMSPADQYDLAFKVAENVGYILVREAEHPDSPHLAVQPASQPAVGGEDVRRKAQQHADHWNAMLNERPDWRPLREHIEMAASQLQHLADDAAAPPASPLRGSEIDQADYKLGWWLAAALEDPNVGAKMKDVINKWFEAHQPGLVMSASSASPASPLRGSEITDAMVNAAAREMWNDRDARHGGEWDTRDPREVCVIQTKATARAALRAALTSTERTAPKAD